MNNLIECSAQTPSFKINGLRKTEYQDGNLCVLAVIQFNDGMTENFPISVNLPDKAYLLKPGEFFLKNWSEGTEIAKALLQSCILVETGVKVKTGFVVSPVVQIRS